jgi:undecaprenyl-diphosphatase
MILETLKALDQEVFLFLNNLHVPVLDFFMYWLSDKYIWFPFYLIMIIFIVYHFKTRAIYSIITLALVITACDRFTSGFMKPYFARLRPCHDPAIQDMIHLIAGCGGSYGFASSHAANAFGLAMFFWLLLKDKFKYTGWIFLWASLVAYSRIAMGVHYPGDILTGSMVGALLAYVIFQIYKFMIIKFIPAGPSIIKQ